MKNEILFTRMKKLVSTERRIGVEILECLYEIDRLKAYVELKYDGLYSYCIKELGFTESQAYQRIQAMRALKELPELKPMIESGALSVSSISKVQTHLRQEKKMKHFSSTDPGRAVEPEKSKGTEMSEGDQKLENLKLFQSMENHTSSEVDQKLAEVRGEKLIEKLVLELDEEAAELWKEVRAEKSQKVKTEPKTELKLRTSVRTKTQAETEAKTENLIQTVTSTATETDSALASVLDSNSTPESKNASTSRRGAPLLTWRKPDSRYIPLQLKREIWRRDEGKCTKCNSKHAIEIDHIEPFALGGKTEKENLRLLCRSCNQHAAILIFGPRVLESKKIHQPSTLRL